MAEQPAHTPVDLTIIIPIYNALPYFRKCIESITGQNLGPYSSEVILVDDGSTDGSGEYCDEVASQWDYIRAIHIENSGTPARPRNIGLEEANGNYIFFCDADDYFEENALALMLDHAYEDKCDVGLFKMKGEGRGVPQVFKDDKIWKHCTVSNYKETNSNFLRTYGPWKLYDRTIIETNDIRFPEKVALEDLPFTLKCYFNATNICIYNDRYYYYFVDRDDNSSLTQDGGTAGFWGKLEPLVSGLENYLSVAAQYCSPSEQPLVYRRGLLDLPGRILPKLKNADEKFLSESLKRIRTSFRACENSNSFRQTLELRLLVLLDALFQCDDTTYIEIFDSWPENISIDFTTSLDGVLNYVVRSDSNGCTLLQSPLPLDTGNEEQPIKSLKIFKNQTTHFQITNNAIETDGHARIICRLNQGEFTAKFKTRFLEDDSIRRFENVAIDNLSSTCVYASVYKIEFDWNVYCPLKDILPASGIDKARIYFSLDIDLDTGKTISKRLGHAQTSEVHSSVISRAVWYDNHLFAPYENPNNNLSCFVYSDTHLIKTASIEFSKHDDKWYLESQGTLIFNNYTDTQIELVVKDKEDKDVLNLPLKKGTRTNDKKFKGSFKLNAFDESQRRAMASFEVRVAVVNKTLFEKISDIKVTPTFANQISYLQTSSDAIEMAGHAQLVCKNEQTEFNTRLRANFYDGGYDRWIDNVAIQNTTPIPVYGTTYVTEFNWSANCPFEELVPTDYIDPSRIYFFLDAEFDSGESVSERLGHDRADEVYSSFISQAIWHSDHLFAPYETKYKNFSLNVYSNVQLIKTTFLKFSKGDSEWYLEAQGSLNFDNYASTQIELVVLDNNDKEILNLPMEKGEDIKDRTFKGSFKLNDLDDKLGKGDYNFELRVTVTNKTLRCQNFEISAESKSSASRDGKRDRLYETNSDALIFATY